jgi:hypothetical protein
LHIQEFKQKLKNALFVTLGWFVLSSLYAVYYVVSNLATPGDAYAMTWDFQLLMFFIFRVPFLVLILLVLIAVVLVLPPRKNAEA